MNKYFNQDARMGRLTTVLGPDALALQRFEGTDHLNALYEYQVDCLASISDLDFDGLLGTHATISLHNRQGALKHFDGIVTEVQWLGAGESGHKYRLTLKPWLFLSSLRRNQRIFHNKTAPEIIDEVLSAYISAGAFKDVLTHDYPQLEYTVQFRESDFAFVSRLMERFGISYYFKHEEGGHLMMLTDVSDMHDNIGYRPFKPDVGHHQEDIEHFWEWGPKRRITTGAIRLTDYNFKTPQAVMEAEALGAAIHENGDLESYEWPGDYLDQAEGKLVAKLSTDREAGQGKRYEAFGDIPDLGAGMVVGLSGDPVPGTGGEYVCLSATHSYTSDNYGSGGTSGEGLTYSGRYILMPSDSPLVPELKTPLADVRGPQTAMVVGNDEIDCDEYGRILVRFHWDLANAYSMRCRVSQSWAGSGWGGMVIPRVGMEVVVEFLDGDPDKPLVTGCVYNARNMPPGSLPAKFTQSTFKTNSVGGGGSNELTFEDQAGSEFVYMNAQKDHNTNIGNDESHQIGNNRSKTVGNDQTESIGNNHSQTVGNNHSQTVGNDKTITVTNNHTETIGSNGTVTVQGNLANTTNGTRSDTTMQNTSWTVSQGAYTFTVGASTATYTVKGDVTRTYQANHTENTTGLRQVGASGLDFSTGGAGSAVAGKITLNASNEILLTCGVSSLSLKSDGTIALNGVNLTIDGTTSVAVTGTATADFGGAATVNVTGGNVSVGGDSAVNVTSGGTINSQASGEHSVMGSVLKLN